MLEFQGTQFNPDIGDLRTGGEGRIHGPLQRSWTELLWKQRLCWEDQKALHVGESRGPGVCGPPGGCCGAALWEAGAELTKHTCGPAGQGARAPIGRSQLPRRAVLRDKIEFGL